MSTSDVTREGIRGDRPGRDAPPGRPARYADGKAGTARPDERRDERRDERPDERRGGGTRGRRGTRGTRGRGEQPMVPEAEFASYYGRPILKKAPWQARDIAGYLWLGGLAAGCSLLAAGAEVTRRPRLARPLKTGAVTGISLSAALLIHDLGRPARFHHMLRVMKPTSPMSVGSWILAVYGPLAGLAAVTDPPVPLGPGTPLSRALRPLRPLRPLRTLGTPATLAAAAVAPAVATYTAVLVCDTAIPAWHEAYREMPFVFAGSGMCAAAGLGMLTAPVTQTGPARSAAAAGAALEIGATRFMERRVGFAAEPYRKGGAGRLMRAAETLSAVGAAGAALLAGRNRAWAALCGAALLAGSACTRLAVFSAGQASAEDPKYVVLGQRERLAVRDNGTPEDADG